MWLRFCLVLVYDRRKKAESFAARTANQMIFI